MNAVGFLILIFIIIFVALAPRRWALIAIVAGVLFLTQGQSIDILGFNFFALRFIELTAFFRVFARGEFSFHKINVIDRCFILLFTYTTVVFLIRSEESQAYQIGTAIDAFLCYFAFRGLIRDADDFKWLLRDSLLLLLPYTALILTESFTRHNPFTFMGGIEFGDWERAGRLRCQGSFRHASLLGTFGATMAPLYVALFFQKDCKARAVAGVGCSLLIVWASNSGGPVNCLFFGVIAWSLWGFRQQMRPIRWGILSAIILLALVMKAPIWYLPAKVSAFTGGGGYHRSYLMVMAEQNFGQWWLAGMPIHETSSWFPYIMIATGGADMTNQFLYFGITAGVFSLLLLVALVVLAYRSLGRAMRHLRQEWGSKTSNEYLLWGLGSMLTAHVANWLSITYFDQTYALWYLHLAAISGVSIHAMKSYRCAPNASAEYPSGWHERE